MKFRLMLVTVSVLIILFDVHSATSGSKIFAAKIIDSQGINYLLTDLTSSMAFCPDGETTCFEVRRGESRSYLGFEKIKSLDIDGSIKLEGYPLAQITLTSGDVYKGYIYPFELRGVDNNFGSKTLIRLDVIKSLKIEFLHDGTYKKCPLCNIRFYNNKLTQCPFDKTNLQ